MLWGSLESSFPLWVNEAVNFVHTANKKADDPGSNALNSNNSNIGA